MRHLSWALAIGLCFWACSAPRKLSQVGLREPASVKVPLSTIELREKIITLKEVPANCPAEIRQNFSALAKERAQFPPCPDHLEAAIETAWPLLKVEERSTLEEVVASQCRSMGFTEFGSSLENMFATFDGAGPNGRRSKRGAPITEQELQTLQQLKSGLQVLVTYHLPLDRWIRRNGEYLLPNEELNQLHRLIVENSCRMMNQEVDGAYRTIRSMEELSKILPEDTQREIIVKFLNGVHKMIDTKVKDFFYP